jgi:hypothetical protein
VPTPTQAASGSGGVSGAVHLQGAAPPAGTLILVDGAPWAMTGASGAFQLSGLSSGTHVIVARRAGMLDSARAVSIGSGTQSIGTTTLLAGDLDGDDAVRYEDFGVLFGAWGACAGTPGFLALADFDGDGCNGYGDYRIMYPNYRQVGPTAWQ